MFKAADRILYRPGIARTVGLGLTIMALLLLLVSSLSLIDLFRFQNVLSGLSHTALPQVTLSARLSSLMNQLLYQTERLSGAYSQPDRRIAYAAIKDQFKRIRETASWIEFGDAASSPERQLNTLEETLDSLNDLVLRRIDAEEKADKALAVILNAYGQILRFAQLPHSSASNAKNISAWANSASQCIELAGKAEGLNRLHKLGRLQRTLEKQLESLHTYSTRVSGGEHVFVLHLEKRLEDALLGPNGLIPLLSDRITISGRNFGKGNFVRSLVEEVNDLGAGLFMKFNDKAAQDAAHLSQRVHREAWVQVLLTLIAILAAACVLFYFRKVLITRLINLNKAVLDRVAGTNTPIQDSGNDEIARIAQSINYFTIELNKAKEIAESASQAKSKFLADMSHEIRTPLSTILGMAYLMARTDLTGKQKGYVDKVDGAARHLLGIIDNILDFSKIEAGKMELESVAFDLEDLLLEVADITAPQAEAKNLELLLSLPGTVPRALVGDPLRLRQSLINLVGNSVKFTKQGEIDIAVVPKKIENETISLEFSVRDTGIGLSENEFERLFQSFQQADNSITRRFGGSGLGLTITRNLVELMGGLLKVASEPGKGTCFSFELSFGVEPKTTAEMTTNVSHKNLQVLVIEENAAARQIFQDLLESLSFSFVTAATEQRALELLEQDSGDYFGLVLVDDRVAKRDYQEMNRRIRNARNVDDQTKILLVGGVLQQEAENETLLFDGYMQKPVTLRRFVAALESAFGKSRTNTTQKHLADVIPERTLEKLSGASVLLVEDQAVNREMTREILEQAYLSVDTAENGLEALQRVLGDHDCYDLVLMDLQMPVLDGYEATRRIREQVSCKELPIIALTAHAIVGEREKCIAAGMNDYLTKPIEIQTLFQMLEHWTQVAGENHCVPKPFKRRSVLHVSRRFPHSLPGLEVESGLERILGDEKVYWKMLSLFAQENATALQDIQQALEQGDQRAVILHVHSLKGVAANISAQRLAATAREFETAVKSNSRDLHILYKRLEDEFNLVLSSINHLGVRTAD